MTTVYNPIDAFFKEKGWGVLTEGEYIETDLVSTNELKSSLGTGIYITKTLEEEHFANTQPELWMFICEYLDQTDDLETVAIRMINHIFVSTTGSVKEIIIRISKLLLGSNLCGSLGFAAKTPEQDFAGELYRNVTDCRDKKDQFLNAKKFIEELRDYLSEFRNAEDHLPEAKEFLLWIAIMKILLDKTGRPSTLGAIGEA